MFSTRIISYNTHYFWKNDELEVHLCAGKGDCLPVPAFPPFLYLTSGHLMTQTTDIVHAFRLVRRDGPHAIALFQCVEKPGNIWESPANAPFGGIQCDVGCRESELTFFLECIKDWVNLRSGKRLLIKTAPSCYNPILNSLLHIAYLNTGFIAIQANLNSFISINSADFNSHIRLAEKRRLKKAANAGFKAGLANELSSIVVFEFLEKCRAKKGYRMSLTWTQMNILRQRFPENYLVFTVMDGAKIIALTLTVRVSDRILYNFLCADLQEYRIYSPVVKLMECVYQYCQQEKIEILDLGISLDQDGNYKPSLSRFKRNIGGQDCTKLTYEINLAN